MMYSNETIRQYLDDLAARMPAPGGGSAAALSGAIGSALISMTLNFTIGNAVYKAFEETAREMLIKAENFRSKFIALFEEDIKGYEGVSGAYKLPKANEADKTKRKQAIKEALKQATLTPLRVCQYSVEAIKFCPDLARSANKNLICDVAVPVYLLEAAFYSAKINVVMNQKSIEDEAFNNDITEQLRLLEKELLKHKEMAQKEIAKVAT
jgi:methenyltetrahydrofolate cyclohydrolase